METIELTLILAALVGFLINIFLTFNFDYWKKRGVSGPKPKILVGNVPGMFTHKRNVIYDIDDVYREYKSKDRFAGIFSARNPQLMIIDPKLVQDVLITNFKNFHDNEFASLINEKVDPILSQNPFFLRGAAWKDKRAEITPALTSNRIKASYPIMQQVCLKLVKYLESASSKSKDGLNGREVAAKFTTEVVSNCIYGIEAGAFSDKRCQIHEVASSIFDESIGMMIYFVVTSIVPYLRKIFKKAIVKKNVAEFFTDIMNQAIRIRKDNKSDRIDFLNYLLQLQEKKNLSELQMAANTITFFLDGFDTSSIVIANCLHLLAENLEIQQTLRNEINAAFAENGELTFEKLNELPYLDQCFNESLRLRAPIQMNSKVTTAKSFEFRNKKDKIIKIDEGTIILLPYYSLHHDEKYYPNPEKFDPERFSELNGGTRKYKEMGVFYPFGDGPRICLGMRFGICQSKAAIAEVIRNFHVSVNSKTKSKFAIDPAQFLCVPDGGIWLDFRKVGA